MIARTIIKPGHKLTSQELEILNKNRAKYFGPVRPINPQPNNDNWDKKYFLTKTLTGKLLAFGRFHQVFLKIGAKNCPSLGIASIVSLEPKKGYGRKLLNRMKKYARKKKLPVIGFCEQDVAGFYQKCGFEILAKQANRLVRSEGRYANIPFKKDNELIIYDREKKLTQEIKKNLDQLLRANRIDW